MPAEKKQYRGTKVNEKNVDRKIKEKEHRFALQGEGRIRGNGTKTRPDVGIFWRPFNRIAYRRLSRDPFRNCRHERPIGFARITRPRLVAREWISLPLARVEERVAD